MKCTSGPSTVMIAAAIAILPAAFAGAMPMMHDEHYYLPDESTSKIVTVTTDGESSAGFTVLTQAVAIKETGPKETVKRFGEVYTFAPSFMVVHRDEPTTLSFWNLQADDDHDFMLADPEDTVLMHAKLPALKKTQYVFTFHREGVFNFYCAMHQPAMSGQILVLPPATRASTSRADETRSPPWRHRGKRPYCAWSQPNAVGVWGRHSGQNRMRGGGGHPMTAMETGANGRRRGSPCRAIPTWSPTISVMTSACAPCTRPCATLAITSSTRSSSASSRLPISCAVVTC